MAPIPAFTTSLAPIWRLWREGRIAVTPIHFDLTHRGGLEVLREFDLQALLVPALDGGSA